MSDSSGPRILVVGCGAIGGTITAHLTEMGADVIAITTNDAIAKAVQDHGFRVRGDGNPRSVTGRIGLAIPDDTTFDLIMLATQPPQVEEAAHVAMPHLAEHGDMVIFQNGLCEERIATICGAHRVIGAIIAWGASMPEPGVYDRTSSGGFTLGRLDGKTDVATRQLGSLLEVIGPVKFTKNLLGARWSKLAINCCISSLGTIGGDTMGSLVKMRKVRRLGLEVFTEAVAVSRRENITLEKVAGTVDLDWVALTESEKRTSLGSPGLAAKHALLLAVGMRYRRLRSSMLSAIERGRTPAIDFLNGEIVDRGAQFEIDCPVNAAIVETVRAIARGEMKSSRKTIDELYERTRRR